MKKTVTIIGILLLAGLIAYPVFACGPGWGGGYHMRGYGGGPGYCRPDNVAATGLSPAQRERLDALDRKFLEETDTLRNEIWSKKAELDRLLEAQTPDEAKIKSIQKEISTLSNQLAEKRLNYRLETRKVAPDAYYDGGYGCRYFGDRGRFRGGFRSGPCWN